MQKVKKLASPMQKCLKNVIANAINKKDFDCQCNRLNKLPLVNEFF